jgi:uncharacterized protein
MYQGTNITADISPMVTGITYTDRLVDAAGEAEIELEDRDKRWQGPWYPQQGDWVNLMIGYQGQALLPCGDFQVDDLELAGPPDVFRLRCLAAYITPAMRTPNSIAYENQTLMQIADTIAGKYGLAAVNAANPINVSFARVTQKQESDLQFLGPLARCHDYEFTIRGQQLIFYARAALEARTPVVTISRAGVLAFRFRSRTHRVYRAAQASYQQPADKRLVTQTVIAEPSPPTGDTLKLAVRCENGQQALLKAQSALHEANMVQATAWLQTPASAVLSAGNNVTVDGFGAHDGIYLIQTARHRLTRARGYTSEIEARKVN